MTIFFLDVENGRKNDKPGVIGHGATRTITVKENLRNNLCTSANYIARLKRQDVKARSRWVVAVE